MNDQNRERRPNRRDDKYRHAPRMDENVLRSIRQVEEAFKENSTPFKITGLNGFQRKQLYTYFEKKQEYRAKSYKEKDDVIVKVYAIGHLKRLAEKAAQEVLMQGEFIELPPMSSFERYVIHDYLKDREGLKTESYGEGKERHIQISPQFGRSLKKVKKRLTR